MLTVRDVHAFYGQSHILHGVNVSVEEGQVIALLGRNGVGKTTLLRSIVGMASVLSGSIKLRDQELAGLPPYQVARLGCAFVPEDRGIFPRLTVHDHLCMGPIAMGRKPDLSVVYEQFPRLCERAGQRAESLSGGERAILAIARALLMRPSFLLIDELSEGVQPNIVQELGRILKQCAEEGMGVIVVDQDARFALRLSDKAYILEKGRVVFDAGSDELIEDETILQKHLVV